MAKIEKLIVNGKTYQVQTLGVIDTLNLHMCATNYLGPVIGQLSEVVSSYNKKGDIEVSEIGKIFSNIDADKIKELQLKTFKQVITPKNNFLSDEMEIEQWFGCEENASDVWEVFIRSLMILLGEYLPSSIKSILNGIAESTAQEFISQKNS